MLKYYNCKNICVINQKAFNINNYKIVDSVKLKNCFKKMKQFLLSVVPHGLEPWTT